MMGVFPLSHPLIYNTKNQPDLSTRPAKSVYLCTESLGLLGPRIWELVLAQLKSVEFPGFKSDI